jgi:glycosyltransferase involved in cell wall biosynthesis
MSREFNVIAIIAAFNEGDIIGQVVKHLIDEGVGVYLLDHGSTDGTVAAVEGYLGKGLLRIERFPEDSGFPPEEQGQFAWTSILKRKEMLAQELDADWFIHHDADEFRESPWAGVSLAEAIGHVDAAGFNAINFALFNFHPTHNRFRPGADVRKAFRFYEPPREFDRLQVKCWKKLPVPVDLASSGGHDVTFEGRLVAPIRFILRHYPIRGQAHGTRKVFRERKARFVRSEREQGWHVQYDGIEKGARFVRDPAELTEYDGARVRVALSLERTREMSAAEAPGAPHGTAEMTIEWQEIRGLRQELGLNWHEAWETFARIESSLQAHRGEVARVNVELGARRDEVARLHQEIGREREAADKSRAESEAHRLENVRLEREAIAARQTAERVGAETEALVEGARIQIAELQQQLDERSAELDQLHQERGAPQVEANTLQRGLAVQKAIIAGLQQEAGAAADDNDRLRRDLAARRQEIDTLRRELDHRRRERRAIRLQTASAEPVRQPATPSADAPRSIPAGVSTGPRFLVITDAIPTPDLDAGSFRLVQILMLLIDMGYRVTFVSHSLEPRADYAGQLRQLGIPVLYGPEAAIAHLESEGSAYAHVMLSRPEVAFRYLFPVRAHAIYAQVSYDTVDLHWVRMERAAEVPGARHLFDQAQHFKRIELFSAAASDLVLAVTVAEKETLLEQDPALTVDVLPTVHPAAATGGPWDTRRDLMFIGGFWHQPNEDGVCYFADEILPLIRRELPDVVFNIIGSHMSDRVKKLESPSVRVLGYVPDPTSYFTGSRVFVSPLRYGAGMKGKIGHSMSHGLPVVTTSIGAEGLLLVDGDNALIADDPQTFAQAVVRLYNDRELWSTVAARSANHIAQHFSASATRRRLERLFPIRTDATAEVTAHAV